MALSGTQASISIEVTVPRILCVTIWSLGPMPVMPFASAAFQIIPRKCLTPMTMALNKWQNRLSFPLMAAKNARYCMVSSVSCVKQICNDQYPEKR